MFPTPGSSRRKTSPALLVFLVLVAAWALCLTPSLAQEEPAETPAQEELAAAYPGEVNPLEAQKLTAALAGLVERARMVTAMTSETAREYRKAAQRRKDALDDLARMQHELDRFAVRPRDITIERIESLERDVEAARLAYQLQDATATARLSDLRRLVAERDALGVRIADIRSRLPRQQEQLTGVWEVTWMPAGATGRLYLDQSGTLVSGQYQIAAVGEGSLQGTFVGGKLFLQRIDSKRGRDAEIEGVLDADGNRLRGSWQAYELAQGGLPQGQWVARRVQ